MPRKHEDEFDLVVIGGGVGGLVTASVAGQLGLDVALIEREPKLGGDCLHYGCVPSKTLIRSAEVAHLTRTAKRFGVDAESRPTDLARVMERVREVVDRIQVHDEPERFRGYGIDVRFGEASFVDAHTVSVGDGVLKGRRFVIATGSSPAVPPVEGLEACGYLTNETVFAQQQLPGRLVVMGGGPVGVELAQAFARLGSEVTLVEMGEHLLPREDPELSDELAEALRAEGIHVRTRTAVQSAQMSESEKVLCCAGPDGTQTLAVDEILVAAGRQPNVAGLALENAGVDHGRGGIEVDARMRTSARHIFACGDCCGPYPLTHVAEYQAGIVIANAVFRWPKKADYRVIPWATYTDPELAHVGLTEAAAREQGMDVQIARFAFEDVDRAIAEDNERGRVKLVVHRGRLVGASILGPHAGELIHEAVLAIQSRIKIGVIAGMVHAYPTLSQIHRRAVNSLYSPKLFAPRTRTAVRWLNRLLP
ncbi:MAG: FAD-dependent oxidoreductase [Halofilum sp. (in: g-proteobacteria)]